ncbi:MAG: hypothetical protein WKF41_17465 [Gaiellaceae bacterium]
MTAGIDFEAVPLELRERPQWVVWRLEQRDGKPTKAPYRPDGCGRASSTDPGSWATFETAVAAAEALNANGIGYVFSAGDPFVGVDLDAGLAEADKGAIILALDSYSETSVSGTGVHVFVRGSLNGHGRNRRGPFEVYESGRYFCVTGKHLLGTPATIEERQSQLEAVLARFLPPQPAQAPANPLRDVPLAIDDEELLERARTARNGEKFQALWAGQWEGRYGSQSEADSALCGLLGFWTGRDPSRVDSLFRRSGLMRAKWDSRRGESTYGAQTIERSLSLLSAVYDPSSREGAERTRASKSDVSEAEKTGFPAETERNGLTDSRTQP